MTLPLYQIDAFSSQVFGGNPAAVCPLETWLPDDVMQAVAAENQNSMTLRIDSPACMDSNASLIFSRGSFSLTSSSSLMRPDM